MAFTHRLEEVLKLIAETGDRCIVMQEGVEPYVIMDLTAYRTLLRTAAAKDKVTTMTETELLDKINQDIAEWRESRREELSEYDLSQFRLDKQDNQKTQHHRNPDFSMPQSAFQGQEVLQPDLPVVDDDEQPRLEPLA